LADRTVKIRSKEQGRIPTVRFYDCATAPSPRRVRIFMAEKDISLPTVPVDLRNAEHMKPEFRALNPWCTVPVIELDDGTAIAEVAACCRYLEELKPEPPLMGTTAAEKATIAMWDHRCEIDGMFAVMEAFRNATPGFKGRALPGPDDYEQIPELAERGRRRVQRFFEWLDLRLAEYEYVAGPRYSVADITALAAVDFAGWAKLELPETLVNAARWHEAVSARPSAQA
jgi:glutathione S-transferase